MSMCGTCMGSGHTSCSACGGLGYRSGFDVGFNQMCAVCAGKGRARCFFCGGRGQVGAQTPPPAWGQPAGPAPEAAGDRLAGRWAVQGGYWEFVQNGGAYRVTEYTGFGVTGQGEAQIEGDLVNIRMRQALAGDLALQLRFVGASLQGVMTAFGMRVPLNLTRL